MARFNLASWALAVLVYLIIPVNGAPAIDFARDVAPLLQGQCLQCHRVNGKAFSLATRQAALDRKVLIPGKPDGSSLFTTVRDGSMPPGGPKLTAGQADTLRQWIEQGAPWPADLILKPGAAPATSEVETVRQIREKILQHPPAKGRITIPNTTVSFDVVPISAGDFAMGEPDEKPVHRVHVDAFSMQAHEVTWDEYLLFMFATAPGADGLVDAVSRPTRPYVEMSFGMGTNGFPAISMTQHAANKYAEWLSAKTGEFYRLPTEAEWEYACRADVPEKPPVSLEDSAWYNANSKGAYQKVATKKPNGWGLYDMLGNVMEWTLDQYRPYSAQPASNPWVKVTAPYPIAVRGGSWNDPPAMLRCTARVGSDPSWKEQDPQLPKSIWYETDAQWLGFRLVRPVKIPTAVEMYSYWNNGVEHDEQ